MGACVSGELPESYLPQLPLDGTPMDVGFKKSATRIILMRIRDRDQARIRQLAQQHAGHTSKQQPVIEVTVRVTQGALSAVRVTAQRDAGASNTSLSPEFLNPSNWSTSGYSGPGARAPAEPVRYDQYGRVLPPSQAAASQTQLNASQTVPGGTATLLTPHNASQFGADDRTGVMSGFYGPFATGINTPSGFITFVPHHVPRRAPPQRRRYATGASYVDATGQHLWGESEDLGLGGIRFRLTAAMTRNFALQELFLSMVCVEDGRATVSAQVVMEGELQERPDEYSVPYDGFSQSRAQDWSRPNTATNGGAREEGYVNAPYSSTQPPAARPSVYYDPYYPSGTGNLSQQPGAYFDATGGSGSPDEHAARYEYERQHAQEESRFEREARLEREARYDAERYALEQDTSLGGRHRAYLQEQHALVQEMRSRLRSYEDEIAARNMEIDDLRATRPTQAKYLDLEEKYRLLREENREIRHRLQEAQEAASLQSNDLVSTLESQLHAYKLHSRKSKEIILKLNDKVDEKRRKVALLEAEMDTLRKRLHYKGAGVSTVNAGSYQASRSESGLARANRRLNYEGRDMRLYGYLTRREYAAVQVQAAWRGMMARRRLRLSRDTIRRRKDMSRRSGSRRSGSSSSASRKREEDRYNYRSSSYGSSSRHRSSSRRRSSRSRSRSRSSSRSPSRRDNSSRHRSSSRRSSRSRGRSHSRSRSRSRSRTRSRSRSPRRSSSSKSRTSSSSSRSRVRLSDSEKRRLYKAYARRRSDGTLVYELPRDRSGRRYTDEEFLAAQRVQAAYRGHLTRMSNPKAKLVRTRLSSTRRSTSSSSSSSRKLSSSSSKKSSNPYAAYAYGKSSSRSSSSRKSPSRSPSRSYSSASYKRSSSSSSSSRSRKFGGYPTEEDFAAAKIQAGFRGMKARKKLSLSSSYKRSSSSRSSSSSSSRKPSLSLRSSSSRGLLRDPSTPKSSSKRSVGFTGRDEHRSPTRSSSSSSSSKRFAYGLDLEDEELQKAAAKIQAGFRGHLFRKKNADKVVKKPRSSSSSSSSSRKSSSSSSSSSSKPRSSSSSSSSSRSSSSRKSSSPGRSSSSSSYKTGLSSVREHSSSSRDRDRDERDDRDARSHKSSSSSSSSHRSSSRSSSYDKHASSSKRPSSSSSSTKYY